MVEKEEMDVVERRVENGNPFYSQGNGRQGESDFLVFSSLSFIQKDGQDGVIGMGQDDVVPLSGQTSVVTLPLDHSTSRHGANAIQI